MQADNTITGQQFTLLSASIFIIAACSLVYELLISSLSTYLLGSSVIHYSVTIGLFLFFMGVGSWLAQSITRHLIGVFVAIEIGIGAVGGISALILYAVYTWTDFYYPVMLLTTAAIGILVGMEVPLLTRILESHSGLRKGISQVLTFDYLGALLASLLFPFVLLPYLGHLTTASVIGLVNLWVAMIVAWSFRHRLGGWWACIVIFAAAAVLLVVTTLLSSGALARVFDNALYEDPVIYTDQSRYQKIVMTKRGDDLRLYLDGNLQLSSMDEYRYHETLVHLPARFTRTLKSALVIGGGDGMAVRELLRYSDLDSITVVDLDDAITDIASTHRGLTALNHNALTDDRVTVINTDAWQWLADGGDLFELIVVDLPDPENEDVAKLYSVAFYQRLARRLSVGGVMITQATSPWFARRAFWSIGTTLEEVFNHVLPATAYIPSFGLWGFFIASDTPLSNPRSVIDGKYINENSWQHNLQLPSDLPRLEVAVNHGETLPVLRYYREGWSAMNHAFDPSVAPADSSDE
ncbi:MAG: polyamine aminopropyltransferase [Pseudomonadota bacterium]